MEDLPPELISNITDFIPGARSFACFRLTSSHVAKSTRFNAIARIEMAISPDRDERKHPDGFLERINRGRTVLSKVEVLTVTGGRESQHSLDQQLRCLQLPLLRELRLTGLKTNDTDSLFAMLEHHAATLRKLYILGHSLVVGSQKGKPEYQVFQSEAREAWLPFLIRLRSMRQLTSLRIEDLEVLFRGDIYRDFYLCCSREDAQKHKRLAAEFPGSIVLPYRRAGLGVQATGGQEAIRSALEVFLWEIGAEPRED